MYKKIIAPKDELQYKIDGFDIKYILNEGSRSIGLFAFNKNQVIPAQINSQDICIYLLEGRVEIEMDEKIFNMSEAELILIPKTSSHVLKIIENTKFLIIKI